MKIELKRVTYNSRLSEETAAFAADLWINGKKRGDVLNDGHGGPDRIHPYTLAQEIEAYAATLPKWKSPWGGPDLPHSADTVIGGILSAFIYERDLKRAMKTKTLFVRDGVLYEVKKPGVPKGDVVVLNALPFDEALKAYRKAIGDEPVLEVAS